MFYANAEQRIFHDGVLDYQDFAEDYSEYLLPDDNLQIAEKGNVEKVPNEENSVDFDGYFKIVERQLIPGMAIGYKPVKRIEIEYMD